MPQEPNLSIAIRIRFPQDDWYSFGPGKAVLLEAIHRCRSISAAGRSLDLSYSKTRRLVDEMNLSFKEPLVVSTRGGLGGGEVHVTALGLRIVTAFRAMEVQAREAVQPGLETILAELGQLQPS